jgi:hypothetical protein
VDIQEDQIPLSDVAQNNVSLPVTKKMTKPQPVSACFVESIGPDSNISLQKTSKNPPTKSKGDSKRVKITEFEQYVKEAIVSGELKRQHSVKTLFAPQTNLIRRYFSCSHAARPSLGLSAL